ncbi:MAG: integrase, partial [Polaromonas sp.]|nr:integrase [Polaromonas sp.]
MQSNLQKNRFGVYYVRYQRAKLDVCRSLRTKNRHEAERLAHLYNLWLMSKPTLDQFNLENLKKLDVVLPNGVSLLNIHTDEDEARAQRLIA